jgi:hypothetical protein
MLTDDYIGLYGNGTGWGMVMNVNNGNFGIGTGTPAAQLHTTGTVRFAGAGTPGTNKVLTSDAAGNATWQNAYSITDVADEFSATSLQTSFTLTQTPSTNSKVKMYINGIRISNSAYSVSGTTVTYIPANNGSYLLVVSDRIQFDFFK